MDKMKETFLNLMGFALKIHQAKTLYEFLNGRHTFVALPTGYGKSLCFMAAPLLKDKMTDSSGSICVVISPLRALMANQVAACEDLGISAAWLQPETADADVEKIRKGQVSVVYMSPEYAVGGTVRQILLSHTYRQHLCLLVFDEAHCISEWGLEFRPSYRKVDILMSLVSVPVMFLTATPTEKIYEDILQLMCLEKAEVSLIGLAPDRPNIFLKVVSEPSMRAERHMIWYWEHLKTKQVEASKAVIFTRDNQQTVDIFSQLSRYLGDRAFKGDRVATNRIIDIFTADSGRSCHDRVLGEFPKKTSVIRCLICTTAFGMGIDIPDIDYVILWGAPSTTLSFWQQAGRAGRDGRQAEALLLGYKLSLLPKSTDDSMRDICTNKENCVRESVLKNFTFGALEGFTIPSHCEQADHVGYCKCDACKCCGPCRAKCKCNVDVEHLSL